MIDPLSRLQAGLHDAYAIERELGRGGMATVFLARDLKHDRPVALKVLHPELAASLGAERFLREIHLAARLQHPHILTVLDSGHVEVSGSPPLLWFSMPYIRGESLRDRLARETQLPVEDALRIAREAADALGYAHEEGFVHRDVKPENILLTAGGHALVADFGIARALSTRSGGAGDDRLTETGLTVGTPAYMSPEQASGGRDLDARTDLYSLAIVLYEMLAGETPFAAPTAQAMIARRFTETARPVRQLRDAVPETVEAALQRALARTPADRFSTASELAAAFAPGAQEPPPAPAARTTSVPRRRRVPIAPASLALGFVLGLGLLFGWLRRHGGETPGEGGPKRLAVIPFENLGGSGDEYFADGVTDEVRGKLAALPGLQVTARSSSNQYKKSPRSPQEIGRDLGVDYLLTGTVRWEKSGGASHVRVSPELIQVSTGSTRWQQPFDAALTDVFKVQADVAGQVAQALDVALSPPQKTALAARPTANAAAYDAYLKGEAESQGMGNGDPVVLGRAITYYEQAVALDSGFVQAWAQVSRAYSLAYVNGRADPDGIRRSREAAERALQLAPDQAISHLAMGDYYVNANQAGDLDKATAEFDAGLRIAPNDAELLGASAIVSLRSGNWDEALVRFRRAQALDPRSLAVARRLAYTLLRLRRYPEAMTESDRALALQPDNVLLLENKVMVYLAQGDLDGAQRVIREQKGLDATELAAAFASFYELSWALPPDLQALLLRLAPSAFTDRATWAITKAEMYKLRGDRTRMRAYADSAQIAIAQQLAATPDDPQNHLFRGIALAYLGRKAEAIAEGERGRAFLPVERDAYLGPYMQHQMARIYVATGEYDKALDLLEPLLEMPYYLSPAWLRIDPEFDPLRKNPRFQKLVAGT
jgi:serine/threonine-protein kinase